MSKYWNSRIKNIIPYAAGEQPKDKKFIKLNTNENPYPPSPKVIEAIVKAANGDLRLYPDPSCAVFREAAAVRYGVKPEQVFAGNGSDEVLAFIFGAFFENSNTDDIENNISHNNSINQILFPDITYSFYPVYANLWNIPCRTIPLNDNFEINTADYMNDCGGVIFPNPNAPTGISVPLGDILSLAEHLEKSGKILVVDEAYAAFGAESSIPYINKYPNLLTVHTLSKQMSLAGLRFGFAIGSEELIEGLCRIRDSFNSYVADRIALAGAAAAINDAAYYNEINGKIILTRERIANELKKMGFYTLPSSANFIFIKAANIKGIKFFTALREHGILVRHFNKDRIADFLRVTIGTDSDMDRFLEVCKIVTGG